MAFFHPEKNRGGWTEPILTKPYFFRWVGWFNHQPDLVIACSQRSHRCLKQIHNNEVKKAISNCMNDRNLQFERSKRAKGSMGLVYYTYIYYKHEHEMQVNNYTKYAMDLMGYTKKRLLQTHPGMNGPPRLSQAPQCFSDLSNLSEKTQTSLPLSDEMSGLPSCHQPNRWFFCRW